MQKNIDRLMHSGLTRLKDARNKVNSLEGRFEPSVRCGLMHFVGCTALSGFSSGNRYIVFQVLPHTLGLGPEVWRVLAECHEIRNRSEYEGDLDVDERLVIDLITACGLVADKVNTLPALRSGE